MKALGRHILAELYGCSEEILNDLVRIKEIMINAALEAGAEILEVAFHKFSPQGISGVIMFLVASCLFLFVQGHAAMDVFFWSICYGLIYYLGILKQNRRQKTVVFSFGIHNNNLV